MNVEVSLVETLRNQVLSDSFEIHTAVITPESLNNYHVGFLVKLDHKEGISEIIERVSDKLKTTRLFMTMEENQMALVSRLKEEIFEKESKIKELEKYKDFYDMQLVLKHGKQGAL